MKKLIVIAKRHKTVSKFYIYCATWLSLSLASLAYGFAPPRVKRGELKLGMYGTFFQTTENYVAEGDEFDELDAGSKYKNLQFRTIARYGISNRLGFDLGVGMAHGVSESKAFNRSNTTLTDANGKLFYRWRWRRLVFLPFFQGRLALSPIDEKTDEVITYNGSSSAGLGLGLITQVWNIYPYISGSYNQHFSGQANQAELIAGIYQKFEDLRIGVDVTSTQSVSEDEFTTTPATRTDVLNKVNAGSLKYYSVNPSLLTINPWVGIELSNIGRLQFAYNKTINGESSAAGWGFSVVLSLILRSSADVFRSEPKYDKVLDFKQNQIESQQYDQDLFETGDESNRKGRDDVVLDEAQKDLEK